jgi:tripartite-type tricarboxylate transporter receptor subunit TctC
MRMPVDVVAIEMVSRFRKMLAAVVDAARSTRISTLLSLFVPALLIGVGVNQATAQEFPQREIRIVIGFPAGSGADLIGRHFADKLRPLAGHPVIVENKPGGGGSIASVYTANAVPDGHVVYLTAGSAFAASVHLLKNPPVDPRKDLEPVGTLLKAPWVMAVSTKLPISSVDQLTAYLKQKGDKASYAATTNIGVIMAELYKSAAGLEMAQVNYRTPPDAMNDLASGRVDVLFADVGFVLGRMQNNQLRPLAVSTAARSFVLPNVPTMKEAGFPGIDLQVWWIAMVPARTPAPAKAKLNKWFEEVLNTPETKSFLASQGSEIFVSSPEQTTALLLKEIANWADYVRIAKIEPQ